MGGKRMLPLDEAAPRTAAEALEAFGRARLVSSSEAEHVGIESALDVVGSFCDEIAPLLLDPLAQRRLERQTHGACTAARELLDPLQLLRTLGPCAALFPYQIVAGSGVLDAFRAELPRLARWLVERGVGGSAAPGLFDAQWRAALPALGRHRTLQGEIEQASGSGPLADHEMVIGRFFVEDVEPLGMWVRADGETRGPVRLPPRARGAFSAGQEVSLAFRRGGIGWMLLAAGLPCVAGGLDAMVRAYASRS